MKRTKDRGKSRRMALLPDLLRERSWTTNELAAHLGCGAQEIQRDLRHLRELGFTLARDDGRPPRYHLSPACAVAAHDPVRTVVTHAMLRLLHHHAPTPSRVYHDTLTALTDALPERLRDVSRCSLNAPFGDTPRILETIAAAWCWGQPVRFLYEKPGETPQWDTLHIAFMEINRANLDWYVIGRRPKDASVKTFLLTRIRDAGRLPGENSPPIPFDPQLELADAWGIIGGVKRVEVVLCFDASVRPWVMERRWPGMTDRVLDAQGRPLLSFNAPLHKDGVPVELYAWIRGWGPNVEVLEPPELREQWLADARCLLERYAK